VSGNSGDVAVKGCGCGVRGLVVQPGNDADQLVDDIGEARDALLKYGWVRNWIRDPAIVSRVHRCCFSSKAALWAIAVLTAQRSAFTREEASARRVRSLLLFVRCGTVRRRSGLSETPALFETQERSETPCLR
jgi:hypothetical protein